MFLTLRFRPLFIIAPQRARHSMTNLYETLGVTQDASFTEIESAYRHLTKYYIKENGKEMDFSEKVFFDDLTLSYTTLINKSSRAEYDEYLSQN